MSRKVYIEAEVRVLVPVTVKVKFLVRADEDANVERAITQFLKGKEYKKADVEFSDVKVLQIATEDAKDVPADNLGDVLNEAINENLNTPALNGKLLEAKVIDSSN